MKNHSGKWTRTIAVLACMLVFVGAAVAGTMAYVSDITGPTVNTFVIGDTLDGDFILKEHKATDEDLDGEYELDYASDPVTENVYAVMPGVDIPKDPFVKTSEALEHDAYVYIEIVDTLNCSAMKYAIDDAWTEMNGVTGINGGQVYMLTDNNGIVEAGTALDQNILKDNRITVANETISATPGSLSFYGYMIQTAGFTDAADAWTKGFGGSSAV